MNDDEIADIWETIFVGKWGEIKVSEWNLYKKFARAIAEKEREECAKVIDAESKETRLCAYYANLIRARGQE